MAGEPPRKEKVDEIVALSHPLVRCVCEASSFLGELGVRVLPLLLRKYLRLTGGFFGRRDDAFCASDDAASLPAPLHQSAIFDASCVCVCSECECGWGARKNEMR